MKIYWYLIALVTCLLSCSVQKSVGGGTETPTEPSITLSFVDVNNNPVAGAAVRLRSADYRTPSTTGLLKRSALSVDGVTDNLGFVEFKDIEPGSYSVECLTLDRKGAWIPDIQVEEGEQRNVLSQTVQGPSILEGIINADSVQADRVLIVGMERSVPISDSGTFVFSDLPPGNYVIEHVNSTNEPLQSYKVELTNAEGEYEVILPTPPSRPPKSTLQRTMITIQNHTANLNNNVHQVPLYVSFSGDKFIPNAQTENIYVTKENGTLLPHYVSNWNNLSQTGGLWVLVDTIYASQDSQSIQILYEDKPSGAYWPEGAVFDTANGYRAMWHFDAKESATTALDATYYQNSGIELGANSIPSIAGIVHNGLRTNGVDQYVSFGNTEPLRNLPLNDFSACMWVYPEALKSIKLFSRRLTNSGWDMGITQNNAIELYVEMGTKDLHFLSQPTVVTFWNFVCAVYDSDTKTTKLYHNGSETSYSKEQAGEGNYVTGALNHTLIGRSAGNSAPGTTFIKGSFDEAQILSKKLNPDWIRMVYESQKPSSQLIQIESHSN